MMDERDILSKYIPKPLVDPVLEIIKEKSIHLKISRERKSKLGDFRPKTNHLPHRISVNHNLNPYAFFMTFIHEVAHLVTFESLKNLQKPHGEAWKSNFRLLMKPFLGKGYFPDDLEQSIIKYMNHIKASSHVDIAFTKMLRKYDDRDSGMLLEELQPGDIFLFEQQRKFKVIEKRRTRYKCLDIKSKRIYLVHALTPVLKVTH